MQNLVEKTEKRDTFTDDKFYGKRSVEEGAK